MSHNTSRFICPSSALCLKPLLRKALKGLWLGLGVTLAAHLSLTQIRSLRPEQKTAKPLTTRFVKRQPRLTKPLEMRKRPQPKKRSLRRQMVAVKARTQEARVASGIEIYGLVRRLARPRASVSRYVDVAGAQMEPQALAGMIQGEKEAKNIIDASLDMLDVDALDTGRYHALVIQDPTDKRNIKGFFRLKYAYSLSQEHQLGGKPWRLIHALNSMIDAMNQYTNIQARYEGQIPYTSPEMMKTPWVFCQIAQPFVLSDEEAKCLGKYLTSGGFVLCDAISPVEFYKGHHEKRIPVGLTCAHHNFKLAMATQGLVHGRDWTFDILPHSHPIFHCYFDFDGTPGSWYDTEMYLSGKMEGITLDDRLLLGIIQKAVVHIWGDPLNPQMREERMVQFGINTIIFALTQEGSITHRVIDIVR